MNNVVFSLWYLLAAKRINTDACRHVLNVPVAQCDIKVIWGNTTDEFTKEYEIVSCSSLTAAARVQKEWSHNIKLMFTTVEALPLLLVSLPFDCK